MRRRAASVRPGPDGATRPSRTGLTGATTRSSNSSAPLRPPTSRRAPSARSASREPSRGTSTRIIWPSFVGRRVGGGLPPRGRGGPGGGGALLPARAGGGGRRVPPGEPDVRGAPGEGGARARGGRARGRVSRARVRLHGGRARALVLRRQVGAREDPQALAHGQGDR